IKKRILSAKNVCLSPRNLKYVPEHSLWSTKDQITPHTEITYFCQSFHSHCSIYDCLEHGLAGIWAHLQPVLASVKQRCPELKKLIFANGGFFDSVQKQNQHIAAAINGAVIILFQEDDLHQSLS